MEIVLARQMTDGLQTESDLYPFPHMTILQRMTLDIFCQKIENLYNKWIYIYNLCLKAEITEHCKGQIKTLVYIYEQLLSSQREI